MQAHAKHLRISAKKANLIAGMVRGKKVSEALNILKFTPKKAAKLLGKVVKSAAANAAHNFKQEINDLYIKQILVGKGSTLKRSQPVSRGRSHPILKRMSHVKVTVGLKEENSQDDETASKKPSKKLKTKTAKSVASNS